MVKLGLRNVWMALLGAASVIALAGCGRLPVSAPAAEQSTGAETITVTGYGEANGDPDVLTVEVGVSVSSTDISQAVASSNTTIERITGALGELGIDENDVQTTGFNVWPEDIYSPVTGSPTGEKNYRVDSTLRVKVKQVDRAGVVLEAVIKNGANNIYGMTFGIQDTTSLASQARTAAIADARVRAAQLAKELGVTLGEVQKATEVSGGPIFPAYAAMGVGGGGGVPVTPGLITVSISVEVTFAVTR